MRILYATDGSEGAKEAGLLLAGLPLPEDCSLTILTVASDDRRGAADEVLNGAAQTLGHSTASVDRRTRWGHPVAEIVRAAEEESTDLIVLGSHGHSAVRRFLLGSVAERVARHSPCPVLVVRQPPDHFQRVVVGVDGSEGAVRAADWLRQFPLPPGCEVRLVTVIPNLHEITREHMVLSPPLTEKSMTLDEWQREQASTRLAEIAASFADVRKPAVTEIRSGDPAVGLLEVALDKGADLIVVGAQHHSKLERFLLGSVSQQVLCHAHCSVLVVRNPVNA
jgi:nucleotide-binding universal stress UspA family protein